MPNHSILPPEIAESELRAVRRFLTAARDEDQAARPAAPIDGLVPLRKGIARARSRACSITTTTLRSSDPHSGGLGPIDQKETRS